MKKIKWILIVIVALGIIAYGFIKVRQANTKKYSPEDTVGYIKNDLQMSVFYNRPYKKGRPIFGGLVPYNEVWRTGANEATVFTTNKDLTINGQHLPAGKYTLWTIPDSEQWQVIFNERQYIWGVTNEGVASRDPQYDTVNVFIPIETLPEVTEQFTISFAEQNGHVMLRFEWDQTRVSVPISY
ncbi:MAG: DUF2911 domain-containing protein [Bacteroidetes bacterium]|nr:DUF2911 domain-containing protein [Bacteroidota bacterium]